MRMHVIDLEIHWKCNYSEVDLKGGLGPWRTVLISYTQIYT